FGGHAAAETSEPSEAKKARDAIFEFWRSAPPEGIEQSSREYWLFLDRKNQQFAEQARAFARQYPQAPERLDLIVQSGYSIPYFIAGFKPQFDTEPTPANFIVDEAARAAFVEEQMKLN